MGWTKQEGGFADTWDFRTVPEFEGTYLATKTIDTKKGPRTIHAFKDADGVAKNAWGTTALDNLLDSVEKGQKVRITFNGKIKLSNGNDMNDFSVDVWIDAGAAPPAAPLADEEPF